MIVVLAGGLGAARFLRGLVRVVPPEEVTVVGNTGDDITIYGVHVSPDLDIVTYMLSGELDEDRQFGLLGDTHHVMDELDAAGHDTWFALGDRDMGVCAARTAWLAAGIPLHECAARIANRFGVGVRLLPMTDDPVFTVVRVRDGDGERDLHFQEYWVRRRAADPVVSVRLEGAEEAVPAPGVLDAIASADAVLIAPSNPVVSVGTILAVPGIRAALGRTRAPVVGVSPIIGGAVVRGMADKLLPSAGAEVSAAGVAGLYLDFLDGFVIDEVDAALAPSIEALGIAPAVVPTLMRAPEDAAVLAKATLDLAERLSR
jgi:LPPG:FO 2-phospho-L-lactate transferase